MILRFLIADIIVDYVVKYFVIIVVIFIYLQNINKKLIKMKIIY